MQLVGLIKFECNVTITLIFTGRAPLVEISPHAILPELVVGADFLPLLRADTVLQCQGLSPIFDGVPTGDARYAFGATNMCLAEAPQWNARGK